MAEEGAGQHGSLPNLAGFYIGVVELFAILLPGAILTFLLFPFFPLKEFPQLAAIAAFPAVAWIAFAIAAYAMGHILFGVGSVTLDRLYDIFYKAWSSRLELRRERVYKELEKLVGFRKGGHDNALDWTLSILALRSPGSSMLLDHLEADSKFLRSLVITLMASWPLLQFARGRLAPAVPAGALVAGALILQAALGIALRGKEDTGWRYLMVIPAAGWVLGVVWLLVLNSGDGIFVGIGIVSSLLAIFASLRYMSLRAKRTRMAYELLLVSYSPACGITPPEPPPSSHPGPSHRDRVGG